MKINSNILIGFAFGACIPVLGYILIAFIFEQLTAYGLLGELGTSMGFVKRMRTIGVLAIATNLIPFQYFKKKRKGEEMRGIVIATFIYAVIWIVYYWNSIIH